jgi:hypothetical protein
MTAPEVCAHGASKSGFLFTAALVSSLIVLDSVETCRAKSFAGGETRRCP